LSITCALFKHSASAKIIRNAGHSFSACVRCKADLVEVDGKWAAAPTGFRIVWKEPSPEAPESPPLLLTPPASPPEPVLDLTELAVLPAVEARTRKDRRTNPNGKPPAFLGGIDRRRGRDRRRAFGKKPIIAFE
jgi:hypothetical protein